ncbi:hypothetical protein EO92_00265 [Methanosarcina sp. 2.H.A.1B.4]|nr:hypothetical protein EO92_00265 [Methanosarcina sp. 2.H.A.1B.4]
MGFRPILFLFYHNKKFGFSLFPVPFASKSASELKTVEKALGRKKNENKKRIKTHLGRKT